MVHNQAGHNLSKEIGNWQRALLNGSLTPDDVEELTQHLQDEMEALKLNGLNDEEAWFIARYRMGQPVCIEDEFNKVNHDFAINRNLLMLFWGGTFFILLQTAVFCFHNYLNLIKSVTLHVLPVRRPISVNQTRNILHLLSVLLFSFVAVVIAKANNIIIWFNNLIVKRGLVLVLLLITIGWFTTIFNSNAFKHPSLNYNYDYNYQSELSRVLDVLCFVFYNSFIFCTAWFTMRYRKKNFRTSKVFWANITWTNSLCIGIIIELFLILGNIMTALVFKFILGAILFLIAGYIVSKSKKPLLNLFTIQCCAFLVCWVMEYWIVNWPFYICTIEYIIAVLCLLVGFILNKLRELRLHAINN